MTSVKYVSISRRRLVSWFAPTSFQLRALFWSAWLHSSGPPFTSHSRSKTFLVAEFTVTRNRFQPSTWAGTLHPLHKKKTLSFWAPGFVYGALTPYVSVISDDTLATYFLHLKMLWQKQQESSDWFDSCCLSVVLYLCLFSMSLYLIPTYECHFFLRFNLYCWENRKVSF